jgi:2-polyprenyl-6-methoxyphenol hydroxylase-like FAD-dependent oxidoreductase
MVHVNERFTLTLGLTPIATYWAIEVTLAGDAASVMAQWAPRAGPPKGM